VLAALLLPLSVDHLGRSSLTTAHMSELFTAYDTLGTNNSVRRTGLVKQNIPFSAFTSSELAPVGDEHVFYSIQGRRRQRKQSSYSFEAAITEALKVGSCRSHMPFSLGRWDMKKAMHVVRSPSLKGDRAVCNGLRQLDSTSLQCSKWAATSGQLGCLYISRL